MTVRGVGATVPAAHGLEPQPTGTACYRGYVCRYTVERRFVLRDLELGSEGEPPRLGGAQPRQDDEYARWHYQELDIPVAFTGRLLIGSGDLADRPYLNMGFLPAWMYTDVHELTLRAGALLSAADCSAALATVRADLAATASRPAAGEPTQDWITRTFSLAYEYSWPGRRQRADS